MRILLLSILINLCAGAQLLQVHNYSGEQHLIEYDSHQVVIADQTSSAALIVPHPSVTLRTGEESQVIELGASEVVHVLLTRDGVEVLPPLPRGVTVFSRCSQETTYVLGRQRYTIMPQRRRTHQGATVCKVAGEARALSREARTHFLLGQGTGEQAEDWVLIPILPLTLPTEVRADGTYGRDVREIPSLQRLAPQ